MRRKAMLSACVVVLALATVHSGALAACGSASADVSRVAEEVRPDRPRARPLPGERDVPRHSRRAPRPSPRESQEDSGPIGCPDQHRKLELIV